jgi:hypothetical protein
LGETEEQRTPLEGVLERSGAPEVLEVLTERLSGSELTTLLLEVVRRRASRRSPTDLVRTYQEDRFVVPGSVPFRRLRRAEEALVQTLPEDFELLVLAPVVPLGTHSVLGLVDQKRVISTIRQTEVAADPTNALALDAALRRRGLLASDGRSIERVRLAASQRVLRGQRWTDPNAESHFHIFALITAGRDAGHLAFERESALEHVRFAALAMLHAGVQRVRIDLTDLTGREARIGAAVREGLPDIPEVEVTDWPDRTEARGYYSSFCFKARAIIDGVPLEIADGGLVDWTQRLVPSGKERLFISGVGIDPWPSPSIRSSGPHRRRRDRGQAPISPVR